MSDFLIPRPGGYWERAEDVLEREVNAALSPRKWTIDECVALLRETNKLLPEYDSETGEYTG